MVKESIIFMKKFLPKVVALCIVLLVITTAFSYLQYQQNQRYEKYLSLQLGNNLSHMISGITLGNSLLMEIIEFKKISYTQFSRLRDRIQWIGSNGNDLINLTKVVELNQNITSNEVLGASNKIGYYLKTQFTDELKVETDVVILEKDQLCRLEKFQKLINLWAIELEKQIKIVHIPERKYMDEGVFLNDVFPFEQNEFRNLYIKNSINRKDWRELMYRIEEICNKNKEYYKF